MSKTIKSFAKGQMPRTIDDLVTLRERICKGHTLEKIQKKGSPAVFTVHVGGEMIEYWQDGGWANVIEHYFELFPHIPDALNELGLRETGDAFQSILSIFPEFPEFDEDDIYDVMTFLTNHRLEVFDDRLKRYSREKRIEMSKAFRETLERLDDLSERDWGYRSPREGWEGLLRYVERNFEAG